MISVIFFFYMIYICCAEMRFQTLSVTFFPFTALLGQNPL